MILLVVTTESSKSWRYVLGKFNSRLSKQAGISTELHAMQQPTFDVTATTTFQKKKLLKVIVPQCVLYKFIHFVIQSGQFLTPKSHCIPIAFHHMSKSRIHVRRDSNPKHPK
jgi:hypothetical protein